MTEGQLDLLQKARDTVGAARTLLDAEVFLEAAQCLIGPVPGPNTRE